MISTQPLKPSYVTISGDFKQQFVYCHKDHVSDSLRRKDVELEESKQRIEQDRAELRARHMELELRTGGVDEMKQTQKPFSFRRAILRQDRQADQEHFAEAQARYDQAQKKLVQDREPSYMITYIAPQIFIRCEFERPCYQTQFMLLIFQK
jgi:hypothetical protein